jgi:3-isopropylmalate/(R)-2-methylmalate dehydratase small subunit
MNSMVRGKIFYCRDYVNTDVMAPGRYDPIYEDDKLARIALIDYDGLEPFVDKLTGKSKFQIIVAGEDFGCGSSRETAPLALAAAGVKVVIAKSFARIFFRNCINLGQIYPLELRHNFSEDIHGSEANIDFKKRSFRLGETIRNFRDLGVLESVYRSGGLSQFVAKRGGFDCL